MGTMKHICLLIFICVLCRDVYGQDFNLTICQDPTSAPGEWGVTLENASPCVILQAYLDCKGFQSQREIDSKVILKQGDACIINNDVYGQDFNLTIRQDPTSAPGEWGVTLENASPCVILQAYLDCKGFQSQREIDSKVILKQGDACIVNKGERMNPRDSRHFVYAWENQSIACS
ncbi:hypothetical protein L1987_14724 [Smallanthus sonchifolius]|uniref:Uncharacterized protein n=1 Tax=Smallanthus sonchifolius TaxID=185202 RepID=A0ACB9J444_9ASTR|nr:hypothetical protein L1987_14724 [Smallanthus sonchifolius]